MITEYRFRKSSKTCLLTVSTIPCYLHPTSGLQTRLFQPIEVVAMTPPSLSRTPLRRCLGLFPTPARVHMQPLKTLPSCNFPPRHGTSVTSARRFNRPSAVLQDLALLHDEIRTTEVLCVGLAAGRYRTSSNSRAGPQRVAVDRYIL